MLFGTLSNRPKRVLEPMEKISEILFALIMVLTFTCSFSIAGAGREGVRELVIGALGCNLAWGLIDAAFYLMGSFSMLGQGILQLKALSQAASQAEAHQIMPMRYHLYSYPSCHLPDLEQMRKQLKQVCEPAVSSTPPSCSDAAAS